MATVEQHGRAPERRPTPPAGEIPVENPATGEIVAHRPRPRRRRGRRDGRARRAPRSRRWEALGFDGRARVLLRAQKWVMDNADRIVETIVSETGKTFEDAAARRDRLRRQRVRLLGQERAASTSPTRRSSPANLFVKGKKLIVRYRPLGVVGVIGPWNYPLTNSFGDCIPALAAGNAVSSSRPRSRR